MSLYTQRLEQHLECVSTCVQPDLIFQEDYLSTGKFSSVCQRPLFQRYKCSLHSLVRGLPWKRRVVHGSGEMSECVFLIYGRRTSTARMGHMPTFPGLCASKFLA